MNYPYFTGPCDLRYDPHASRILGKDHWRVLSSFDLVLSDVRRVRVPAGILTDKGTVPIVLNNVVPRDGKFEQAYVVHDQLCEYLSMTLDNKPFKISRATADLTLSQMLVALGGTESEVRTVMAGVDGYRISKGGNIPPSSTPLKRELEAVWAASDNSLTFR